MWAAWSGHVAVVQYLVTAGAEMEAKDKKGLTALMLAAKKGHVETAQCLVTDGAEMEAKDKKGLTALMLAAKKGHVETAQCLVTDGAELEAKDEDGKTALMWAKSEGHTKVTKLLARLDKDLKKSDQLPLTYKSIQEQFSLYSGRLGGEGKPCTYGVYHAGGENYEQCIVGRDDLLSGDIFKRNGHVGAPPAARTLDYFSEDGAVDGMQKSSQDTKQAVSYNDLSVEEALVGPMQKFLLAEEEMIKESLFFATQKGISGPNKIPGWTIQDVPDVGNCFYEAIIHQMQTINHPFLFDVPVGGVPHLCLRNRVNSSNKGEWAEDATIDEFVTEVPVILAIVDTRRPDSGYVCYYLDADGTVMTNSDIDLFLPTDKPIIRIAATGNHFLSVVQNPELNAGRLRSGYMAPVLLPGYSPSFFTRLSTKSIIDQRHENSFNQRAYDNLFGLVPWIN